MRRFNYANVMSTIAVFIALSGSSYAAVTIGRGAVKARNLAANSVTSDKVKNGSLVSRDFAGGQLRGGSTGPSGSTGPAGSPGPQGPPGPQGQPGGPLAVLGSLQVAPFDAPAGNESNLQEIPGAATSVSVAAGAAAVGTGYLTIIVPSNCSSTYSGEQNFYLLVFDNGSPLGTFVRGGTAGLIRFSAAAAGQSITVPFEVVGLPPGTHSLTVRAADTCAGPHFRVTDFSLRIVDVA